MQGTSYALPPSSPSNLAGTGSGFADDHPFGFVPKRTAEIHDPPPGDAVHLDSNGKVQCTSCHDPHQESVDPISDKFLVKPTTPRNFAKAATRPRDGRASAHSRPTDLVEDLRYTSSQGAHTGYTGVSKNGCESCHRPHSAQVGQRLLKLAEENTCYQCHDGTVTTLNIKSEFVKTYRHPVQTVSGIHDDSESPTSTLYPMPEISPGSVRHAECMDCHNAHYANNTPGQAPIVSGALLGVKGQSQGNSYCRSPTTNTKSASSAMPTAPTVRKRPIPARAGSGLGEIRSGSLTRQSQQKQYPDRVHVRHVVPPGRETGQSLQRPRRNGSQPAPGSGRARRAASAESQPERLRVTSTVRIAITAIRAATWDWEPPAPRARTPRNIPHLLERQSMLETPPALPGKTSTGTPFSVSNYGLCDKCHDVQNSILRDVSFKYHSTHTQQDGAACSTCHDPHSSSSPMLINFDLSIVAPNSAGQLSYLQTGPGHGTCNLACHGQDHKSALY